MTHIERYSGRNRQKKDERVEAERRKLHEAQHAQLGGPEDGDGGALTAGEMGDPNEAEDDDKKEVDPSIVGSLDNVYKDEPGADMKEEDPFKKVPMMDNHEKPSSMMEMEKTMDAMVASVQDAPGSPVPEDATSLDKELSRDSIKSVPDDDQLPDILGEMQMGESEAPPPSCNSNSSLPTDLAVGAEGSVDLLDKGGEGSNAASSPQPIDLTHELGMALRS